MTAAVRRRRDPEARRFLITRAAAELITEVGVDAITHRMVAARADVPLGATTQYFATLDDLRDAALQLLIDHVDQQMRPIRQALAERGVTPAVLASLIHTAIADVQAVQADRAVVTTALHDPRMRELARDRFNVITDFIAPVYGVDRATAAAVFIDGLLWHAQIHDEPLEERLINTALTGILGEPVAKASAPSALPV